MLGATLAPVASAIWRRRARFVRVVEGPGLAPDDLAGLVAFARDHQRVVRTERFDSEPDGLGAIADLL
jgi:hypothetical protein